MQTCNYIPLNTALLEPDSHYCEDLFDLDILYTDDGIFINAPQTSRREGV